MSHQQGRCEVTSTRAGFVTLGRSVVPTSRLSKMLVVRPLLVACACGVRDELKEVVPGVKIRILMVRNNRRSR